MIYNRWGDVVEIIAQFEKHQPDYFDKQATLVLVRDSDGIRSRFHWAEFLRADDGWDEIKSVLEDTPEYRLSPSSQALQGAFKDAE